MSVDTITRINDYFKTAVADVFPVFTIYKNVNEDLPEPASGPFVNLWVEPSDDNVFSDAVGYRENGVIIAQIRLEQGESSLQIHAIADAIRNAFRQLKLVPQGGEVGQINIEEIEPSNAGTIPRERANQGYGSNRPWRGWDIFINYSKREF